MQIERCRNSVAWLTMVGLIMISGLRASADDAEQGDATDKKPRAEVREIRVEATQTAEVSESDEQQIDVNGEPVVDEQSTRALSVVEEDVLITTGDGEERSQRILRINAEPAGDVLAVRLAEEAAQEEELAKYWIGVQINEVSPALRAQLNLDEGRGVLIGEVLADSPASKAGVKQYDILLAIGETKVSRNDDVLKAVNAADGKEIKLTLLRGGSERSVTVSPAERPKRETVARLPQDRKALANWFQNFQQFQQTQPAMIGELPNMQFNVVKPGQAMVLTQEVPFGRSATLPEDLSITVTREGKAPAKIKIKQKEREIDTTEDKLNEIPEDVRRYVEPMLGRGRAAISMRGGRAMELPQFPPPQQRARIRMSTKPEPAGDVLAPAQPGQEEPKKRVRVLPPGGPEGVERRIEKLERRLDELQRAVRPGDDVKK
jgi:membrane-associated protease RseP (regulator of RpoE activity)